MDGKSDTLKVHMELKNKSTTMNHDSTNRETSQIHGWKFLIQKCF